MDQNKGQAHIQKVLSEGYQFSLGENISKGFSLFGKAAGWYILFIIIFQLMNSITNFIPIIGPLAASLIITPCMTVGFYLYSRELDKKGKADFSIFFDGFKKKIGELILAVIFQALIIIAVIAPIIIIAVLSIGLSISQISDFEQFFTSGSFMIIFLAVFLVMIPALYFGISYMFTYPIIAFYGLPAWKAMEASRKLVGKKFFLILLFAIVAGIVAASGVILLIIGVLITAPAMFCASYNAFKEITRLDEFEKDDTQNLNYGDNIIVEENS